MPEQLEDLKVLVVEDNVEAMRLLRMMLTDLRISDIHEAKDGQEAQTIFQGNRNWLDVIICDWNLPKVSGIEFLGSVRATNPDIPFIMVTGASDQKSVVEAKNLGVSAYITKPYSAAQLEKKLKVVLRVFKARKAAAN
jgi:DNA-binding response OmpR family regulator